MNLLSKFSITSLNKHCFTFMGMLGILFSCNTPKKPNIVFVLVDDLGWTDLGCYGSTFYETPHLDAFARQSIQFTNAYAASPVCSPTRAGIMTGKHPARINITDWIPGMNMERATDPKLITPEDLHNLPLTETTIPEVFKKEGYKTFFSGKWHLGETETSWPLQHGFEINKGGNAWGAPRRSPGNGYYSPYGNPTLDDGPEGEYLTDRLTDESIRFIQSMKDQPFFLYLAFYTVHTPIQGCNTFDDQYLAKSFALPDSGKVILEKEHQGTTRINQSDPKYAAMVRSMDTNFGKLLNALEETGVLENTIIIFTSDNGGLSTTKNGGPTSVRPLRAGKGWCYEGGIRVPLMIAYPEMKHAGVECHTPAVSMDYYPTLLELAGMPTSPTQHQDGESLVPYLSSPTQHVDRTMVWHYPHYHGSTWRPGSAIRKGNWKLIEFYENEKTELYDLDKDLGEQTDLSTIFPDRAKTMLDEMHKKLDEMGAQFPKPRLE
jgi:arylsulfatase A-like enzyme